MTFSYNSSKIRPWSGNVTLVCLAFAEKVKDVFGWISPWDPYLWLAK